MTDDHYICNSHITLVLNSTFLFIKMILYYFETFAPVAKLNAVRILNALLVHLLGNALTRCEEFIPS